jgi:hypothetical protein
MEFLAILKEIANKILSTERKWWKKNVEHQEERTIERIKIG